MTRRILIIFAALLVVALAFLAREAGLSPATPAAIRGTRVAEPAHPAFRIVVAAGVPAPDEVTAVEGMPEVPAPTVPTLATMPATAPAHAEEIDAPNLLAR